MSSTVTQCQHLLTAADAYRALSACAESTETRLRLLLLSLGSAAHLFFSAYERGGSAGELGIFDLTASTGALEEAWSLADEGEVLEACAVVLGVVQEMAEPSLLLSEAAAVIL